MGRRRASREPSKVSYYVVLVALAFFALTPLVVLGFNALKTSAELGRNPLGRRFRLTSLTSPKPGSWATSP